MKAPPKAAANASPSTKVLPDASQRAKPGQSQKKKKRSGKF